MNYKNLTQDEAQNWQPEGMFLSLIEQPPKGYEFNGLIHNKYAYFSYTGLPQIPKIITIKLPFAVGDIVGCWYKGELIATVKVTDAQVERVQGIPSNIKSLLIDTYKYMSDAPEDAFKNWFNAKYAKPRKTKDGYVCYLYDDSPESRMFITKLPNWEEYFRNIDIDEGNKLGYYETWKGEQLTIHANPYVEPWRYKECEADTEGVIE